jgi:hypothetical protein
MTNIVDKIINIYTRCQINISIFVIYLFHVLDVYILLFIFNQTSESFTSD